MLQIGQVFNKNGLNLYVLDIIDYNFKKYVLFTLEDEELQYLFYEMEITKNGCNLKMVEDNKLEFTLFNIFEAKGE